MTIAEQILSADDLPREEVATPEWAPFGVPSLYVRGMTADERDKYERSMLVRLEDGSYIQDPNPQNIRAGFVARVCVDENGERVFKDSEAKALSGKSAAAIDRLWIVARRLSGFMDEDENPSKGEEDS